MLQIDIVTPERQLYHGEATLAEFAGQEGVLGVYPGHAPFIVALRPGVIRIHTSAREERFFAAGGFVEIKPTGCIVLAENALPCSQIDRNAIEQQLKTLQSKKKFSEHHAEQEHIAQEINVLEAMIEASKTCA